MLPHALRPCSDVNIATDDREVYLKGVWLQSPSHPCSGGGSTYGAFRRTLPAPAANNTVNRLVRNRNSPLQSTTGGSSDGGSGSINGSQISQSSSGSRDRPRM